MASAAWNYFLSLYNIIEIMRQVGGHLIAQRWCGTHNKGSTSSGSSSSVTGLHITIHCDTRCTPGVLMHSQHLSIIISIHVIMEWNGLY